MLFAFNAAAQTGSKTGGIPMIVLLVIMFVLMYFFMIRPQKKKQKAEEELRNNIQIGDEITTIGGIVGRVVTIKEDSLVIETGADRNKMRITRWAISTNNTAAEKAEQEKKAVKEAAEQAKQDRISAAQEKAGKKKKRGKKNAEDDVESKLN